MRQVLHHPFDLIDPFFKTTEMNAKATITVDEVFQGIC